MTTTAPTTITDEQATLLAQHAALVQGGFSTPDIERKRAEASLAEGKSILWAKIEREVADALASTPAPATPDTDRVDVTAVLAHVDLAISQRERIAALKIELEKNEGAIKAALGAATEGTDAAGNVIVRYPHRSRHGLDKKAVQAILSDADFAACSRVTNYRTLLFGES